MLSAESPFNREPSGTCSVLANAVGTIGIRATRDNVVRMKSHRATEIERAAAGVLDDDLERGKRLVRRLVWGVVLLGAWFCLFTVWLIKASRAIQ